MPKGPQQGDRFGDWYLESRAKPVDGKRMWNVVNTVTDETRVVAQTELKNLENDMPSSNEITARVLAGNHADNPFAAPAAAFEPVFREAPCPALDACEIVDGKHMVAPGAMSAVLYVENPFADLEGLVDDTEAWASDMDDTLTEQMTDAMMEPLTLITGDGLTPATIGKATLSPWDYPTAGATSEWLRVAELARQLSDAICDVIEARV